MFAHLIRSSVWHARDRLAPVDVKLISWAQSHSGSSRLSSTVESLGDLACLADRALKNENRRRPIGPPKLVVNEIRQSIGSTAGGLSKK